MKICAPVPTFLGVSPKEHSHKETGKRTSAWSERQIQTSAWANPENTMHKERSQTQKATYCTIPFIRDVQRESVHRDGEQTLGCQGLGAVGVSASGVQGLWGDESGWHLDRSGGCTML